MPVFHLNTLFRVIPVTGILIIAATCFSCGDPEHVKDSVPTEKSRGWNQESSGDWHDNKFSMFIHWGIYSELAGMWNGEPVTRGYSEQIQAHAGIYSDVYARVASRFNPHKWNPDSIALLAREAGMRSVVITAKHHDGFCMFDSEYTGYNIVQATPYGRDVIKELAEACERQGLDFGLYFSLIDWHYPPAYPISSHNADYIPDKHHQYNMNQVRELLTNYGPVSELWFDMGSLDPAQSRELRELVHSLQPGCMVSGRIGNDMGDFTVMGDNQYPEYKPDTPWQTPASMFDETWSYRSWQERGDHDDKIREKLESLIMVVGRGGNYLLNIGPRGDGSVVQFEKDVLQEIGKWLEINGESIYGTRPAGFAESPPWGEITTIDNKLYLHLTNPPPDGKIRLTGITGNPYTCHILDDPDITPVFTVDGNDIIITLPSEEDFHDIRVVVLHFDNKFTVLPHTLTDTLPFGEKLILDRQNSHKHYSFSGVDYYSNFRSVIRESWNLPSGISGKLDVTLWYSDAEKSRVVELVTPDGIRVVNLQDGEKVPVTGKSASQEFGPIYINGPHSSRIDGITEAEDKIDINLPWPSPEGYSWERADSGNRNPVERPAQRNQCWYARQEIISEGDGEVLVRLLRTDGVQVFLNGKEIYLHNNPQKMEQMEDIVFLPLHHGSNELLVKFYNRFGQTVKFYIDYDIPQVLYRKKIEDIILPGTAGQSLSWYLHDPVSVHSNMAMPNLKMELESR